MRVYQSCKCGIVDEVDFTKPFVPTLKQPICEEINQLIDEVKNVHTHISEQAVEHIYAKEVVLTYGISGSVSPSFFFFFPLLL